MEFTVETTYTFDQFRRYNRDVQMVLQKRKQKIIAYAGLLTAAAVLLVWARLTWLLLLLAVLLAVGLPLLILKSAREVRQAWETNPAIRDVTFRYEFGPAEVHVISDAGEELCSAELRLLDECILSGVAIVQGVQLCESAVVVAAIDLRGDQTELCLLCPVAAVTVPGERCKEREGIGIGSL